MISVFRLCKTAHRHSAFQGEGARLYGGRWNSPGQPVVYTAASLSLATLEVLVHLDDTSSLARLFSYFEAKIPEDFVETITPNSLPPTWLADEAGFASRNIGDLWLRQKRSCALAVPSVVTPGEWNYLLNPAHPQFPEIIISPSTPFRPDPRIL